ncbi:MAG TPA: ASKHA domain-containing protein, partial [Hyphomicrobiales bacterium]|nr:ASKHA domain-containing protein [Hyphomicrobiales bacterium]
AGSCGGHGRCMTCAVRFTDGTVPAASQADSGAFSERRLKEGWRRACQTVIAGDCALFVPPRSTARPVRTHLAGTGAQIEFDPPVQVREFALPPPSLEDCRPDDRRLIEALRQAEPGASPEIDLAAARGLASDLRAHGWKGRAVLREGELIAVRPPGSRVLGLAVDLGTTNISGFLVDLEDGETLAATGLENPQTIYGSDLISYASHIRRVPEGAAQLQQLAVDALNTLAGELCAACGLQADGIVEMTVAGNTMMHHLLLGLPVRNLSTTPFTPALASVTDVKTRELGIAVAPGAYAHLLPNIAGFVGGDHVAVLLASMDQTDGPVIAMDIGTNTEISLVAGNDITSVSCPSGPAFEGGHISCGMRAAVGAIETVRVSETGVEIKIIEDAPPVGICGSGVLDAVAQMVESGIVDRRGTMLKGHPCVREHDGVLELVLSAKGRAGAPPVTFTQHDVRALQLAKGAIAAGMELLLQRAGLAANDLDRIVIAGAFGTYIDVRSAIAVGLLPDLPAERFAQVGNAAGEGARQALISRSRRARAKEIAESACYVELAGTKSFLPAFSKRIGFPDRSQAAAASEETMEST